MTYEESKNLVAKYLTDVDHELLYYYINYLYVTSNHNLLPKNESIEDLLKKANRFGRHLNFYNPKDENYRYLGPYVKGFVRINEQSYIINIREDLKDKSEKIIYHEIHHVMQINEANFNVGIGTAYNFKMIKEAETEYVSNLVYNVVHNIEPVEQIYDTDDIFMHQGGKCISSAYSYQYFDNVLTKLCLLFGVTKDYFVHLNYDYQFGIKIFTEQLLAKIDEYNHQECSKLYEIQADNIINLLDNIAATFYHIYYNKPIDSKPYFVHANNNDSLYYVSPRELSTMVDALDTCLFKLISDPKIKHEFVKYTINPDLKDSFSNEIAYNIKSLTF